MQEEVNAPEFRQVWAARGRNTLLLYELYECLEEVPQGCFLVTRRVSYSKAWGSLFFGWDWAQPSLVFSSVLSLPSSFFDPFSLLCHRPLQVPTNDDTPHTGGHKLQGTTNGMGVIISSGQRDRGWKNASHARSPVAINIWQRTLWSGPVGQPQNNSACLPCHVPLP